MDRTVPHHISVTYDYWDRMSHEKSVKDKTRAEYQEAMASMDYWEKEYILAYIEEMALQCFAAGYRIANDPRAVMI